MLSNSDAVAIRKNNLVPGVAVSIPYDIDGISADAEDNIIRLSCKDNERFFSGLYFYQYIRIKGREKTIQYEFSDSMWIVRDIVKFLYNPVDVPLGSEEYWWSVVIEEDVEKYEKNVEVSFDE